jgi:hypothetical protein
VAHGRRGRSVKIPGLLERLRRFHDTVRAVFDQEQEVPAQTDRPTVPRLPALEPRNSRGSGLWLAMKICVAARR